MPIWSDAVFVWNPGDAVSRSFDEVTSTDSDAALTEGTYISTPRPGRSYNGAVGSRFAAPATIDPNGGDTTFMASVRLPNGTEIARAINVTLSSTGERWLRLAYNAGVLSVNHRTGASLGPSADWTSDDPDRLIVIVGRVRQYDTERMLMELFVDGALVAASHVDDGVAWTPNRLTVGRLDDSSPGNGNGSEVFAAAAWDRALTDAEVRAVSSDPYSYPNDPADPGWETGVNEWEDCWFYWDPNHGGQSLDRAHGGAPSDASLTEGTEVTVSDIPGRSYDGAVGSRFEYGPSGDQYNLFGPFDPITLMVVIRQPSGTADGTGLMALRRDLSDAYASLLRNADDFTGNVRNDGSDPGGNNWPQASISEADDTEFHTLVLRHTGGGTIDLFVDSIGNTVQDTTGTFTDVGFIFDRIAVGRADDNTASNSSGLQVFAAAAWDRALTDVEVTAVLADPYSFPGATPPDAPGNPAASADSDSAITVTWDDVADETGYRVERSADGLSGWSDVSGALAADTTSWQDTGLEPATTYYYRVIAVNAAGDSDPSSTVNATTDPAPGSFDCSFSSSFDVDPDCAGPTPGGGGNRIGGTGAIRRSPMGR